MSWQQASKAWCTVTGDWLSTQSLSGLKEIEEVNQHCWTQHEMQQGDITCGGVGTDFDHWAMADANCS